MTGMMRVPRSRGALSGVLLVLLGAWGGLIPFIGPHFHYAYTPDTSWTYTSGRLLLEILPGAATALGGLIVLGSRVRPVAMFGAWLAALSGAWFAVGGILSALWTNSGTSAAGSPVGGIGARVAEQIGFFVGLGVVIVFLAALALGRFAVVGVKEVRIIERDRELAAEETARQDEAARQDDIAAEETPVAATATPVADAPVPVVTTTPVVERAPVVERTPVAESTPVVERTPAAESTPVVERTPVAEETTPVVTSTPVVTRTPVVARSADEDVVPDDTDDETETETGTPGKVKVTS
jgi:hypothetical protein